MRYDQLYVSWRKSCIIYLICIFRLHQNYQVRKDFRFPRFLHIRKDYFTHSPCTLGFFPRLPHTRKDALAVFSADA